jgi:hypothetical protein
MIHGVLAPEAVPSGDSRGFTKGAVTSRPLRLPIGWQEWTKPGHDGAITVASIDRMMRKDNMIHYEGTLMSSDKADQFAELLAFFGQYGVSIDGLKGNIDTELSAADGMVWFDAVQVGGAVACSVPAFTEAYIALGPHPDMPEDNSPAALTASGLAETDIIGARMEFKRGPGWVTDPKATNRIHDYWTKPGQPGYVKIGWGTPGDFARAKALIGEKIAKHSPEKMRFLNQIIAQWHHDALGYWPATHAKMERGGATKASGEAESFREVPTDERKKMADAGTALPDGSFPIANESDLRNAIQAIGRAKDPAKAKAHIRKRAAALGKSDLIPDTWRVTSSTFTIEKMAEDLVGEAYCLHDGCSAPGEFEVSSDDPQFVGIFCAEHAPEHEGQSLFAPAQGIELDDEGPGWEAVLVSSAGARALPPSSYFDRHPDTGALVIEDPDEFGLIRTYGYAGEWGVCHIGHDGRCVEVPMDPDGGEFSSFHLGRTKTSDEGYINTGVITYKVDHRDAKRILTESAEQQHFDNIAHAWAAVRLGVDDEGIWFSGVVLPGIPAEDLVLIEAAGQVSGEWKYGALRALQAVNVPGFPVMRSSAAYDDEGNVVALVASMSKTSECEPSAFERMQALAKIDAEARFEALKAAWS